MKITIFKNSRREIRIMADKIFVKPERCTLQMEIISMKISLFQS